MLDTKSKWKVQSNRLQTHDLALELKPTRIKKSEKSPGSEIQPFRIIRMRQRSKVSELVRLWTLFTGGWVRPGGARRTIKLGYGLRMSRTPCSLPAFHIHTGAHTFTHQANVHTHAISSHLGLTTCYPHNIVSERKKKAEKKELESTNEKMRNAYDY